MASEARPDGSGGLGVATMGPAIIKQQILSFAGVGVLATLTHVMTALWASAALGLSPQAANLSGFLVAVGVSYVGHSRFTFGRAVRNYGQMLRFAVLSLTSLTVSSGITAVICSLLQGSILAAQIVVAVTVPAFSFLGSRLWAFAR